MSALATIPRETLPSLEQIPLELIEVGTNVRIEPGELVELAASIREHGVLQPVKAIGPDPSGRYRLVFGQRRFMASQIAEQPTIPAFVEPAAESNAPGPRRSIEQLIENLHRADLNAIDRARAMRDVVDAGVTQAALARELGLNPSTVANDLGLLEAAEPVQELIRIGQLTASHAKALKGLAPKTQTELAKHAVRDQLSAHGLEATVQQHKRTEHWQKEREEAGRKAAEQQRAQFEAAIAKLEKKGVAKDAPIRIVDHGGGSAKAIVAMVKKAGFTNVDVVSYYGVTSRSAAAGCDCTAWKMEARYDSVVVAATCISEKHRRAKQGVEDDKRRVKNALQERVRAKLREQGPTLVNVTGGHVELDLLTARMVLWDALGYRAADWAEKRGGKRTNPWPAIVALSEEELAEELGSAIAHAFSDQFGYHLPWDELAAELGVPLEEPKPPAKKAAKS